MKIMDVVTDLSDVLSPILLVQLRVRKEGTSRVTLLLAVEHATVVPLVAVPMALYGPAEPL